MAKERSKNHVLFELYLNEAGSAGTFEKVKNISLGYIVSFAKMYNPDQEFYPSDIVIELFGKWTPVEDLNPADLRTYSEVKKLYDVLDEFEAIDVVNAVENISEYWAKRQKKYEENQERVNNSIEGTEEGDF